MRESVRERDREIEREKREEEIRTNREEKCITLLTVVFV